MVDKVKKKKGDSTPTTVTASGYTAEQMVEMEKILKHALEELQNSVDHTISHLREAEVPPDANDRATQEETFNLELRTRDRERKLIKKIEEALVRLEKGEYGYCESCGIEIGIRRLEARPTATMCIDCKTLEEIRERTGQ